MITELGFVGPAQSDDLFHFTGRNGNRPRDVPEEIQRMKPSERLDSIITQQKLLAFPPFGARQACVCFSECPPEQLAYLITMGLFLPWGVVVRRSQVMDCGGGSVSYVPDKVYEKFERAGLEHWAVRTGEKSTWLHEREWRLPPKGKGIRLNALRAILIGDETWRPSLVDTNEWINAETGELCLGPGDTPSARPRQHYPELWRQSEIWVWDATAKRMIKHPPGTLD
ncbi:hypothetical protein [Streptomyces sp. NPDC056194]|uniref:hypothetical protein n=1 Tax=Streptomyces sp. NPDC056194 TaxID=3345744 RepID=UPI0035E1AEAB